LLADTVQLVKARTDADIHGYKCVAGVLDGPGGDLFMRRGMALAGF